MEKICSALEGIGELEDQIRLIQDLVGREIGRSEPRRRLLEETLMVRPGAVVSE
jgi:hypothetical protein